jgi:transposase-like protein
MQMLYPVDVPIQHYIKRVQEVEEVNRCCPEECPQCEAKDRMRAHGFYSRTIVDDDFDGAIRILRYLCGACRRTVSLLPGWALPYLRSSVPWIGRIVTARLMAKAAWKVAAPEASGRFWTAFAMTPPD